MRLRFALWALARSSQDLGSFREPAAGSESPRFRCNRSHHAGRRRRCFVWTARRRCSRNATRRTSSAARIRWARATSFLAMLRRIHRFIRSSRPATRSIRGMLGSTRVLHLRSHPRWRKQSAASDAIAPAVFDRAWVVAARIRARRAARVERRTTGTQSRIVRMGAHTAWRCIRAVLWALRADRENAGHAGPYDSRRAGPHANLAVYAAHAVALRRPEASEFGGAASL